MDTLDIYGFTPVRRESAPSLPEALERIKRDGVSARFTTPQLNDDFMALAQTVSADPNLTIVWEAAPPDADAAFQVLPGRQPLAKAKFYLRQTLSRMGTYGAFDSDEGRERPGRIRSFGY